VPNHSNKSWPVKKSDPSFLPFFSSFIQIFFVINTYCLLQKRIIVWLTAFTI
jgi:hypothetical protein